MFTKKTCRICSKEKLDFEEHNHCEHCSSMENLSYVTQFIRYTNIVKDEKEIPNYGHLFQCKDCGAITVRNNENQFSY